MEAQLKQSATKPHHWDLPITAKRFNKLFPKQQLKLVRDKLPEFYEATTAFVFLPEMCVVVQYEAHHGGAAKRTDVYAIGHAEARWRLKNAPGKKWFWHHLDPKPITTSTNQTILQ